jgi:hypothetical protein
MKQAAFFVLCLILTTSAMATTSFPTDNGFLELTSSPAAFSCGSSIEVTLAESIYDGASVTVTVVNATNDDREDLVLNQVTRVIPHFSYTGLIDSQMITPRVVPPDNVVPGDGTIQCYGNDLVYVTYDANSELELAVLTAEPARATTSTPDTNDIFGEASPDPVDCGSDVTMVVFDLTSGVTDGMDATLQWSSAETESVTFAQDEYLTGGAGIYSQVYTSGLTGNTSDGSILCTNPGTVTYTFTTGAPGGDTETISGQNFVPVTLQSFAVE